MSVHGLAGCRAASLLGYLKALGILRLCALQKDHAVRGSWKDLTFEIHTALDRPALENFFLEEYAPTPILNPWNNGAGFDGKQDTAAEVLQRIRETTGARWADYRAVIDLIDRRFVSTGRRETLEKEKLVQALRAEYPDSALQWLDAAIVIGREKVAFPYLLGSGGNDGRFDFAVNFASRALDVLETGSSHDSERLLRDAFDETGNARLLADAAIGQFGPRYAGGVNGTTGFNAASLINPWDLVLALEGAIAFSGGLAKRCPSGAERVGFPFAFALVAGGYASASASEPTRGELWLPIWSGSATYAGVSAMLRAGRADLPSVGEQPQVKTALNASQAAQAALSLGTGLGIERFQRIAFTQRNGLAYTTTVSGVIHTAADLGIALLSRSATIWIERVRAKLQGLGAAVRDSLHRFDSALFDYARTNTFTESKAATAARRARARQNLLIALAAVEYSIARRGDDELHPLDFIESEFLKSLDDGSIEHRLARALASLGLSLRERRLRLNLEQVRYDDRGRLRFHPDALVSLSPFLERTLGDIAERRLSLAQVAGAAWIRGSAAISGADIAALAEGNLDRARLQKLMMAYALVAPSTDQSGSAAVENGHGLPAAAFALMKLVIDHPKACDRRIISLLRARQPQRALALSLQRIRTIDGLPGMPRSVAAACVADPEWYAAAIIVPIRFEPQDYGLLLRAALVDTSLWSVTSYLNSLKQEKEAQ